ncbi:hypothetical protein RRG08_018408, partial [Elysia crispata]
ESSNLLLVSFNKRDDILLKIVRLCSLLTKTLADHRSRRAGE